VKGALLLFWEIMKPAIITIAALALGIVVSYLAIVFSYIAYADSTNYFDREGATGMAVVFF
jgi:hypothetical protein